MADLVKKTTKKQLNIQLGVAVLLVVSGIALLFMGFWVVPTGIIHNSVLVAFGEILTFVGALFGIDYKYKAELFLERLKKDGEEQVEG